MKFRMSMRQFIWTVFLLLAGALIGSKTMYLSINHFYVWTLSGAFTGFILGRIFDRMAERKSSRK